MGLISNTVSLINSDVVVYVVDNAVDVGDDRGTVHCHRAAAGRSGAV